MRLLALLMLVALPAAAEPYRLRGTAFGSARAPTGLLILDGSGQTGIAHGEVLVWAGNAELGAEADTLVASVVLRDPKHRGQLRLGRWVATLGGLRPVQLDGVGVLGRLPTATTLEAIGGMPVRPRFGTQAWDWIAGARAGQRLGQVGSVGVAYLMRREQGRLADHEIGVDTFFVPIRGLELAARAAYDLVLLGPSEIVASASLGDRAWRAEVFGAHRSPSRILPATSLFSVLGDVPSQRAGTAITWFAAPRLDLLGSGGVRWAYDAVGYEVQATATLRLDPQGAGVLAIRLERQGLPEASWFGIRSTLRIPFAERWVASTELELVRPDRQDRGSLWPWALVAVAWRPGPWDLSLAFEAHESAAFELAIDGLLRISYLWSEP